MNSAKRLLAAVALCSLAATLVVAGVPRPAPKLAVPMPNGETLDLSDYHGKVIALEFLLTTCPHCKKTSSAMQKLYTELGSEGFQPLGVATNPGAEELIPHYIR